VGLMNQTCAQEEALQINRIYTVHLYIQKGGLDESSPYKI